MRRKLNLLRLIGPLTFLLLFLPATFQTVPAVEPSPEDPPGLWESSNLLGDMGGLRPLLGKYGIDIGLTETSEVLGNLTGGVRRGAEYDGLTTLTLNLDTGKAFHLPGGTFHISALQIHGRNLSADNLDSLQISSNIEADRSTRLWELWFDQAFSNGSADVKIGQQDLSQEFLAGQCLGLYLISAMGWPIVPASDLYGGGPAYPLSSLGIRLSVQPGGPLTMLGGIFDDNPPGGPFNDDSQLRGAEAYGVRFNLTTGALFIGEVQYAVDLFPGGESQVCYSGGCGLPGFFKLGAWYDTARFPDQRFDAAGLSLADPAGSGIARMDRGNFSIYGIAHQTMWLQPGGPRWLCLFVRIMGAPPDRDPVDWGFNAGADLKALLPGRDQDTFGIGYGWAHVSGSAAGLDRDTGFFTGTAYPVRSLEQFVEVTYQYQMAPWWIVQPDLQYIINPGGGIPDSLSPSRRIGNELVLGVRTIVKF